MQTASQNFTIYTTNNPPVVSAAIGTLNEYENCTLNYSKDLSTVFSDSDIGQTLTFTVMSKPSFISSSITGNVMTLSGPMTMSDLGSYSIVIEAHDGITSVTDTLTLIIQQNDPPVPSTYSDISVNEGDMGSYSITAFTDPESDALLYTLTFSDGTPLNSSWISFDPIVYMISYTIGSDLPSVVQLKLTVEDGFNAPVAIYFQMFINFAPKINPVVTNLAFGIVALRNAYFEIDGSLFIDEDSALSYVLKYTNGTTAPAWISFIPPHTSSSGNFEFSITYPTEENITFSFNLQATDGVGLTNNADFLLEVQGKHKHILLVVDK